MKYTTSVDIDLGCDRVVALFADPANYSKWQSSLLSQEHLEGEPGQAGARTKLRHMMGSREVEMIETITENSLPGVFRATYESLGVWNEGVSRFEALSNGRTRWIMQTEFRCKGLVKFLTKIIPWVFRRQTQSVMNGFKAFAEASATDAT